MKHHPFSEYWPLLSGENFEKFKADIAANGQKLPILTYQEQILDGRNRERACEEIGVAPRYENSGAKSDEAALELVVSLNEHRRHLSEDERLFAAARLAQLENGSNQYRPKIVGLSKERPSPKNVMTLEKAAELMHVSHGSATRARTVLKHGTKEDVHDVVSGKISLTRKAEDLLAKRSPKSPASGNRPQNITSANYTRRPPSVSRPALPAEELARIRAMPEKMVSIHVLIEELHPLFKEVQSQSQCHQARVSQTLLGITAGRGLKLLEMWASDDPTVRRMRGHVVPFKQPAIRKKG